MNMDIKKIIAESERRLDPLFCCAEEVAFFNQQKILQAFKNNRIAPRHFEPSSGYAYDDQGKDALCSVYADAFNAEAAIASPLFMSGTHTISTALFGLLRPGDTCLSITGKPYDTLLKVIEGGDGSLKDFKINFLYKDYLSESEGGFNTKKTDNDKAQPCGDRSDAERLCEYGGDKKELCEGEGTEFLSKVSDAITADIKKTAPKVIYLQRSKGYNWRKSIGIDLIEFLCKIVKKVTTAPIIIDNCYGEFVEKKEPLEVGADLIMGSFIKNPGGGLSPTGGYICGKKTLIDKIGGRYSAPGVGLEIGANPYGYRNYFQGVFMAPHTVLQAVKSALLFGEVFKSMGFEVLDADSFDIVRAIKLKNQEQLIAFCEAIQGASPVDGHVLPRPWAMPGYADKVIMAAGTFVQGASIELSADAPLRPPFIVYVQGALSYEHAKIAVFAAAERVSKG